MHAPSSTRTRVATSTCLPFRRLGLLALLVVLVSCVQPAVAGAAVAKARFVQRVEARYYDVSGSTIDQINAGVKARGPGGGKWAGATHTSYQLNLHWVRGRAGCSVRGVVGIENVHYDFPHWVDYPTAGASARRHWDASMAGLRVHEAGHAQISAVRVRAIADMYARLGPRPTCARFAADGTRRTRAIWATTAPADAAYDAATNHGFTQGAWLLTLVDPPAAPAVAVHRNADGSWTDTVSVQLPTDSEGSFALRGCIDDDHVSPRTDIDLRTGTGVDTIPAGAYPAGTVLCYRFWSWVGLDPQRSWSTSVDVRVTLP